MKPRIVILSAFLTPFRSGAEACVEEVPPLLKDAYDFTIITARLRRDLPVEDHLPSGIRVIRIGWGKPVDKWLYPFLAPFAAKKLKPKIIHAVLESFAGLALAFCTWTVPKAKRILTCQSTNTSLFVAWMHKRAHVITVISSVLLARARSFGRGDAVLIPNGVHVQEIHETAIREKRSEPRVLYVGRLEPMKGVAVLLDAFASVVHEFPDVVLHVVGDGSLRKNLEGRHADLVASNRIVFRGYLPPMSVYKEYAQAEIFCGLSKSEALGNVFIEAAAAGCAVIATNVGGIPDVVQDDVTGILVVPNDSTSAATAMRRLLKDHELCTQFGKAGQKRAQDFDWSHVAEQYGEVYAKVLKQ
ncbi:MAG TPA: glycosyltransferase family 4 protein [Candidatus Peribacteraceae bacterium]|nr:glycosyltransferase family 4 protein [Candidatus Peribacteraceae bacterium]